MQTDWDKWDYTAARLGVIEYQCSMMAYHATEIENVLTMMKDRPGFETNAVASLVATDKRLEILRAYIQSTIEQYHKLPEVA